MPVKLLSGDDSTEIFQDYVDEPDSSHLLILYEAIYQHCKLGIVITRDDLQVVRVNKYYCHIVGCNEDTLLGKAPKILTLIKKDKNLFQEFTWDMQNKKLWRGEIEYERGAERVILEATVLLLFTNNVRNYVFIIRDVSEAKKTEQHFHFLAYYDSLTKLMNRNMIQQSLSLAISRAKDNSQRLAIIFMDIDNFKKINDSHGHSIGDAVLKKFARSLKNNLRSTDLVGRFGGDEFVIGIQRQKDIDNLENIISKLLTNISAPIVIDDLTFNITSSVGVSFFPENSRNIDGLLKHADQALYKAKKTGKATWVLN